MGEITKLKKLNQYMRDYLVYFSENSWNADEANRHHEKAIKGLVELEQELENGYGTVSDWRDTTGTGWSGYIEKNKIGYSAVCAEGFGTYETEEEAEAYMIENQYEKV